MKSIENILKRYKEHIKHIDSTFCTKIINIIGEDEFNETCRLYLGQFNADFKAYNFILGAYANKGYHLWESFPELLDIYQEHDKWLSDEYKYCLEMSGLKSEEFRDSFMEYMKPHIISL